MLQNYLRIAFRHLLKYKTFSLINVLGLAIGMTCCILILLWVQDELSYDAHHANAERIHRVVRIDKEDPTEGVARVGAPWGPALQRDYPEVESFVRFRFFGRSLVSYEDKRFYESNGLYADSTIFEVFTFSLIRGNPKTALVNANSMVITESMANRYFGSADPLDKVLLVDNQDSFEITGVVNDVPENSHFTFDFLVSFSAYSFFDLHEWRMNNFHSYVLLSEGSEALAVEKKLPTFVETYIGEEVAARVDTKLQPLLDIHLHSHLFREFQVNGDTTTVYLFAAIAFFILIIACINFMNLATARSASRGKEVGLRKVVGAQRQQLIGQFLGESVLVTLLALVAAIGLAELALPAFNDLSGKTLSLAYGDNVMIALSLIGIALFAGCAAGAYPAFFLSAFRPISSLQGAFNSGKGALSNISLRKALVVLQFAITVGLIVGTSVIFKQLRYTQNKKLGLNKEQVLVVRSPTNLAPEKIETLKTEFLQSQDIVSVSATANLPGGSDWGMPFHYEGGTEEDRFSARVLVVDHDFVETLEIELSAGRDFSRDRAGDVNAFLINEAAARQLEWADPVGKELARPTRRGEAGNWVYESGEVIGVVKDFHFRSLHETIDPLVMYMTPGNYSFLPMRVNSNRISEAVAFVESKWRALEPSLPFDYFFLDDVFDQMYRAEERLETIFTAFSALAILIGCLGLFGLASFTAEQRTKEIGIRKVLGASISSILFLLSREFGKWILLANVIAGPLAYVAMRKWLEQFAYRIEIGPESFLLAALATLLVASFSISFQAARAAGTSPVKALRYE